MAFNLQDDFGNITLIDSAYLKNNLLSPGSFVSSTNATSIASTTLFEKRAGYAIPTYTIDDLKKFIQQISDENNISNIDVLFSLNRYQFLSIIYLLKNGNMSVNDLKKFAEMEILSDRNEYIFSKIQNEKINIFSNFFNALDNSINANVTEKINKKDSMGSYSYQKDINYSDILNFIDEYNSNKFKKNNIMLSELLNCNYAGRLDFSAGIEFTQEFDNVEDFLIRGNFTRGTKYDYESFNNILSNISGIEQILLSDKFLQYNTSVYIAALEDLNDIVTHKISNNRSNQNLFSYTNGNYGKFFMTHCLCRAAVEGELTDNMAAIYYGHYINRTAFDLFNDTEVKYDLNKVKVVDYNNNGFLDNFAEKDSPCRLINPSIYSLYLNYDIFSMIKELFNPGIIDKMGHVYSDYYFSDLSPNNPFISNNNFYWEYTTVNGEISTTETLVNNDNNVTTMPIIFGSTLLFDNGYTKDGNYSDLTANNDNWLAGNTTYTNISDHIIPILYKTQKIDGYEYENFAISIIDDLEKNIALSFKLNAEQSNETAIILKNQQKLINTLKEFNCTCSDSGELIIHKIPANIVSDYKAKLSQVLAKHKLDTIQISDISSSVERKQFVEYLIKYILPEVNGYMTTTGDNFSDLSDFEIGRIADINNSEFVSAGIAKRSDLIATTYFYTGLRKLTMSFLTDMLMQYLYFIFYEPDSDDNKYIGSLYNLDTSNIKVKLTVSHDFKRVLKLLTFLRRLFGFETNAINYILNPKNNYNYDYESNKYSFTNYNNNSEITFEKTGAINTNNVSGGN